MAFTLPQFNCVCNTYRQTGAGPITYVPHLVAQACQLYLNPRLFMSEGLAAEDVGQMVRFPKGTDVIIGDWIELEPDEGWWYEVFAVERMHKNFPNEYFMAATFQLSAGGGVGGGLVTEAGDQIITEGSDNIVTENSL